jgi:hypothetical protein
MTDKLSDPQVQRQISGAIEAKDDSLLRRVLEGLTMPANERQLMLASVAALPGANVQASDLPKKLPAMPKIGIWP